MALVVSQRFQREDPTFKCFIDDHNNPAPQDFVLNLTRRDYHAAHEDEHAHSNNCTPPNEFIKPQPNSEKWASVLKPLRQAVVTNYRRKQVNLVSITLDKQLTQMLAPDPFAPDCVVLLPARLKHKEHKEAIAKQVPDFEAAQAKAQYAVKWAKYQKTAEFGKHTLKLAAWKAQRGEAETKPSAKKLKDAKAPKRAQTTYFVFTAAERASVKAAHPEMKVAEMAKELGRRWKALSAEEKAPFDAQAASAKKAYAAQLATYKQSEDFAAHAEAVATWKRDLKASEAQAAGNTPKIKVSLPRKPKDTKCPKKPQTGYNSRRPRRRAASASST